MKEFIAYVKSKFFLEHISLIIGSLLALLLVLLVFLRIYTHHNRSITVPDFSDVPIEIAHDQIAHRKLRSEVFDSVFVAGSEPGIVVDQHPKAGSVVKKNRKIYLTINAKSPEKIVMPDLVGITLREARTKLTVAGFILGKLRYRYDMAKNVVLQQEMQGQIIEAGDTVLKGSTIDLVLGKGLSNTKTVVPDLIGMSYEYALNKATSAYLTVSAPIPDLTVEENDTLTPFIYRQHPAHNKNVKVPLGSQITIWVSCDSTKLPGYSGEVDSSYVWPDLNEADDVEIIDDDNSDYDFID